MLVECHANIGLLQLDIFFQADALGHIGMHGSWKYQLRTINFRLAMDCSINVSTLIKLSLSTHAFSFP